jgi:lipoprotein NlpI
VKSLAAFLCCCFLLQWAVQADETNYLQQATSAWRAKDTAKALELISTGIKVDPKDSRLWNFRAQMRSLLKSYDEAAQDLSEAIKIDPKSTFLVMERGMARFQAGKITEALIDFDRANETEPRMEAQNWQRGIALYYLGRYADGRRQFETHHKVNADDVENAVWLFMCIARAENMEAARKAMLPLGKDDRVPMTEIYQYYAGKGTKEEVIKAARADSTEPGGQRRQVFYALFYLAIHDDLEGKRADAIDKLEQAVTLGEPGDYMASVAAIHLKRLKEPGTTATAP